MAVTAVELDFVARLRQRNEEAFKDFVETYSPRIRRWAGRMVADPADIEDITQEVLLASWRTASNLRDDTVLAPWLKTITDNACRMRARRMSRKPAIPMGLVPDVHQFNDPVDVAQSVAVEAALRQMPSREANILRLLYAEDRSLEEAASILAVSPDAAKSLAARARRRFRVHFDGWFRGVGAFAYSVRSLFDIGERVPTRDAVRAGVAAVVAATVASVGAPPVIPLPEAQADTIVAAAPTTVRPAAARFVPIPSHDPAHPSGTATPAMLAAGPIGWMQTSATVEPAEIPAEWYQWAEQAFSSDADWSEWWAWAQPEASPTPAPADPEPSASPEPSPEPSAPAGNASPQPSTAPVDEGYASPSPQPSVAPTPGDDVQEPAASPEPPTSPAPRPSPKPEVSPEPEAENVETGQVTPYPWWDPRAWRRQDR